VITTRPRTLTNMPNLLIISPRLLTSGTRLSLTMPKKPRRKLMLVRPKQEKLRSTKLKLKI